MTPTTRRISSALATLALAVTLAACGDDSSSDDVADTAPTSSAPTEDDLRSALLTTADVPEGFEEIVPQDDDSDVFGDTCLADVSNFDEQVGTDPVAKAKTEFDLTTDAGQASVSASISAYPAEDDVTNAIQTFFDSVDGCDNIAFTDDQGTSYDVDITLSDDVTIEGADQQLSIGLDGTAVNGGQTFPLTFQFYVAQEGALVSAVGTSEVVDTSGITDSALDLAQIQADRVADVLG